MNARCTYPIAADLLCMSEHTGRRRLQYLRETKGYKKRERVTIYEFCEFYRIKYNCV